MRTIRRGWGFDGVNRGGEHGGCDYGGAVTRSGRTYNVSDAAGNAAVEVVRTVTVSAPADTMAPVITLTGSAAVTVEVGGTYTEAGASASDTRTLMGI